MKWRQASGILRIIVFGTIVVSIFIGLQEAFEPEHLFTLNTPGALLPYVVLIMVIGCYGVYMIGNAIRELRNELISFKVLYIINAVIVISLNCMMIIDFITSSQKRYLIKRDGFGDSLALLTLFFAFIDFFPFFITKNYETLKQKSHRFNTNDYKDIIPEQTPSTPPGPTSP